MDWTLPSEYISRILLAALLGFIVGIERDLRGKPAGLRTNMIIAVSSCLFTLLSLYGLRSLSTVYDPSRIASQIVTGVGFLGAGAMIHNADRVMGLTTAANIWIVAAIGMASGMGWAGVASFVTVLLTITLALLKPVSTRLSVWGKRRR